MVAFCDVINLIALYISFEIIPYILYLYSTNKLFLDTKT